MLTLLQVVGDNVAKDFFAVDSNGGLSVTQSLLRDALDRSVYTVSNILFVA